jgi:thioredoxin-like negative regulator of GroEL
MNNLQHIIANDTRAAMHMAVELCESGDFDSVTEAFRWLMQEHEETADYLCDMCANDCDERKAIKVGQSAYDVCERWKEADDDR